MVEEKILSVTDNMRGFRVAKDMSRYRIVVTPSSKKKSTQKVCDIRGYWTEKLAQQDIPRLIEHLRTKRLQTFEKHNRGGVSCNSTFEEEKKRKHLYGRTGYTGPTGRTGPRHDPPDPSAYSTHTSLARLAS